MIERRSPVEKYIVDLELAKETLSSAAGVDHSFAVEVHAKRLQESRKFACGG